MHSASPLVDIKNVSFIGINLSKFILFEYFSKINFK